MRGRNKKTIEDMEEEVAELIAESGQCKQDILADFKACTSVKKRINNPCSFHDNDDLQQDDGSPSDLSSGNVNS